MEPSLINQINLLMPSSINCSEIYWFAPNVRGSSINVREQINELYCSQSTWNYRLILLLCVRTNGHQFFHGSMNCRTSDLPICVCLALGLSVFFLQQNQRYPWYIWAQNFRLIRSENSRAASERVVHRIKSC